MKYLFSLLFFSFTLLFPLNVLAETKEKVPPVQNDWDKGEDVDRTLSSMPSLLRDVNSVYVYSEKELDNVTIGITDISDIIESRPVYIHGTGSSGTHAWIVEGYKKDICDVIYGRDCPTGSGETNIPPTVIDQEVINYLYFNMGWGGQSNGFYLADTFASWDFNTRIGIIHNIQPSN